MRRRTSWIYILVYLFFIGIVWYSVRNLPGTAGPKSVPYNEFLNDIRAGKVSKVLIDQTTLRATMKPDAVQKGQPEEISTERLPGIDETSLLKDLEEHNVTFAGHIEEVGWLSNILSWVIPILFFALIWGFGMRRMTGGAAGPMTFGKSRAKIHDQSTEIKETFADVAGVEEAKAELVEIVDFLKHPKKYQELGGRIPKGVLLVGAPGTGKTLLARAVSGEAGVPFFSMSGSEFIEMFVGVGAARVRDLFEQAKLKAPCIIFIDELDAIGKARGVGPMTHEEREQTLNQLLVEMDGFDPRIGVILMAATNRPEILDPALLRAGRFDRQVLVDRPDKKERLEILKVHAKKVALESESELEPIAAMTAGFVGADLANLVNEAALLGIRRDKEKVGLSELQEAVERVIAGLEKKNRVLNP